MRLRTLGTPALLDDAGRVLLGPGKPLLILAYLEANPAGATREYLATLAWGESDDARARASLRQALLRFRKELGEEVVSGDAQRLWLETPIASDRADFLAAIHARDDARATALYAGPYLAGLESETQHGAEPWLATERTRLARLAQAAFLREAAAAQLAQDERRAVALAERALSADASVAAPWLALIELYQATGRHGERDDLLIRLELALADGTLATDGRDAAVSALRRARAAGGEAARNSAGEDFPLVGRRALLARILDRLHSRSPSPGTARVVVLEGSAGLGKSRLLREVGRRLVAEGHAVIEVTAVSSEQATPWSLLSRFVRELSRRPGAAGMHAESLATLVALDPTLVERYPGAVRGSRSELDGTRLTRAVVDLAGAVMEQGRIVVVVDDLHFADTVSLGVLEAVFSSAGVPRPPVLAASRPGHRQLPPDWPHWQVAPLDATALTELLGEVVDGLAQAQLEEMAAALLLVSGGIPLYFRRATQLLTDDGHLRPTTSGKLAVTDVGALLRALPELSLHRDPSFPVDPMARRVLGYLTVAEEDVALEELGAVVGAGPGSVLEGLLARLAMAGWVHHAPDSGVARIAHAVLREQVAAVLGEGALRQVSEERGRWLAEHGTTLVEMQAAIRLLHDAGRAGEAIGAVRGWRRRPEWRGRLATTRLAPADSSPWFRTRLAVAARPRAMIPVVALLVVAGVLLGARLWRGYLGYPAELVLTTKGIVEPIDPVEAVTLPSRTNYQLPVLLVRNRRGGPAAGLDGEPLRAELVLGADSLVMTPAPIVRNGQVMASTLIAWGGSGRNDSLVVRFAVGHLRSEPVVLWYGWRHMRLGIVGGVLAGQSIDSVRPTIRVRPGELVEGTVDLRYDTPSKSATWVLAEGWGLGVIAAETLTVATLHPGSKGAVMTANVSRRAPAVAGSGWLVWASGAETAAEWIMSRTNWRCGAPIWGDGNDLLEAPDSVMAQAWGGGWLPTRRRLCDGPGFPEWQELTTEAPVAAVRVVVE